MKKLLIVVDMQNDFIDGALGFKHAAKIIPGIIQKLKHYQQNGDDIVFTIDTHTPHYLESIEGKHLQIEHCLEGSYGHEIHPQLQAFARNHFIIPKHSFGSFALGERVKDKQYQSIELCGLITDICVLSNAIIVKSASPNSEIFVDANTVSSNDLHMQNLAFQLMQHLHINILNLNGV